MLSESEGAESTAATAADTMRLSIASVRILRLALGTALSMLFSQIVNWPMSFVAAVITMFILALPLPVMKLSDGIKFVLVFVVAVYAGLVFLPLHPRMAVGQRVVTSGRGGLLPHGRPVNSQGWLPRRPGPRL